MNNTPMLDQPGGLMRLKEAADFLGVSHLTVTRRVKKGTMPPPRLKVGNIPIFHVDDLQDYKDGKWKSAKLADAWARFSRMYSGSNGAQQ